MTSKAQRRKRKITLSGGQEVDHRPTGRDRRHTNQPEDPRKTALEARCRKQADLLTPGQTKAAEAALARAVAITNPKAKADAVAEIAKTVNRLRMKAADDELLASDMGRCIRHVAKGADQADLKEAWAAISASIASRSVRKV